MKRLIVLLVTVALLFSLCSCASMLERMDDPQVRANTETVLDAMLANDPASAEHLFSPAIASGAISQMFAQAQTYLPAASDYELTLRSIRSTANFNGSGDSQKTVAAVYDLTIADVRFIVEVEQYEGTFQYFWITPFEQTGYYTYGDLTSMDNATPLQWLFLLSNLVWIILTVILLIDCCRHKTRQKVLWILVLLFGMAGFYLSSTPTSSTIGFNIGALAYSALIYSGNGGILLRVLFPVGGIIYLCLRKRLHRPKPIPQPYPQMPQTHPTPPAPPVPPAAPQ